MYRAQALRFLQTLYARAPSNIGLYFQVRCIDPRHVALPFARCYGFARPEANAGLDVAERFNAAGRHVFVSVNPRFRPGGKNIDVDGVVALPLDYDDMPLACDAGAKLRGLGLRVGLSVLSGRGAHYYLLLDRYEQRVDFAQALGRRLCRFTGSDNVHARSHVMRLPGTINWKPEVGGVMAKLKTCEPSIRYSLEEILAKLDAAGVPIPPPVGHRGPARPRSVITGDESIALDLDDLEEGEVERQEVLYSLLPERYQRLADNGERRGGRSEAAMGLCRVLMNVGASEDEVATFFRLRPRGIGEVVIEKGLPWLDRTLNALQSEPSLATPDPTALSTVRLRAVQKPVYWDRAVLWLKVEDGPHAGTAFKGGLSFSCPDVWRFCFLAFGAAPAPIGDMDALIALRGKTARVVLAKGDHGLNVTWWWPAMRSSPTPPLCS